MKGRERGRGYKKMETRNQEVAVAVATDRRPVWKRYPAWKPPLKLKHKRDSSKKCDSFVVLRA